MQLQLDFFKPIEEVDLSEKANKLLYMLNEDLKAKEMYKATQFMQIENLIVLIAQNRLKDNVFNIIDCDGKTPKEFSANWRNAQHVKLEVLQYLENKNLLVNS